MKSENQLRHHPRWKPNGHCTARMPTQATPGQQLVDSLVPGEHELAVFVFGFGAFLEMGEGVAIWGGVQRQLLLY
eukprot:2744974-Rhodomonas_salina.2